MPICKTDPPPPPKGYDPKKTVSFKFTMAGSLSCVFDWGINGLRCLSLNDLDEVTNDWALQLHGGKCRVIHGGKQLEEFDIIDAVVAEFEKFDSGSQTFRYPMKKDGESSLKGLNQINIQHFVETMSQIADFLDGASVGISVYLSDLRDSY